MVDLSRQDAIFQIQSNCQHLKKEVVLCDSGPHYAKYMCAGCLTFFKFLSKKDANLLMNAGIEKEEIDLPNKYNETNIENFFEELKETRHQIRVLEVKANKLEYDIAKKVIRDGLETRHTAWGAEYISKDGKMKVEITAGVETKNEKGEWKIFSCSCEDCRSD